MLEVKFYELDGVEISLLRFAVIISNYKGRWIYCKHKERTTWENPGGRIETGETPLEAAKRELQEETGAIEYNLKPLCVYSVLMGTESYGLLCYAEIERLGDLPDTEIGEIDFFDSVPKNLTYPDIQPKLFEKVRSIVGV